MTRLVCDFTCAARRHWKAVATSLSVCYGPLTPDEVLTVRKDDPCVSRGCEASSSQAFVKYIWPASIMA